jgi:hypothetical protein
LKGNELSYLRMDLKVCEGCGVLWLRTRTVDGVYCNGCVGRLAEFPAPRGVHAGGRRSKRARAMGCAAASGSAGSVAGGAR